MKKLNILHKQLVLALIFGTLMGLTACGGGGGGGDDDAPPTPPTPPTDAKVEGAYEGSTYEGGRVPSASAEEHRTIVLDDNQVYTLYGNSVGNIFYVDGFLHGYGNMSGNTFTSSVRDYFLTGEVFSGSLSATFVPGVSLNGSVIYDDGAPMVSFTTRVMPTYYDYNVAAKLSDITGAWSLTRLQDDDPITMNIASTGAFTATSLGCAMNGNILPRASGKNVFNVSMNFGPLPCRLPGQSVSGIAVIHRADGTPELLIAVTNTSRTEGTVMFGTR